MKKFTLSAILLTISLGASAQQAVLDSVEMGNGYANEVYYKLSDGTKSPQAFADWHLGFSTGTMSSTIISNAKNTTIKIWPNGTNDDFETAIDTTGYSSWPVMVNDSVDFYQGAFNQNIDYTNTMVYQGQTMLLDYGWGAYNFATHIVTGDSIYLVKVGNDVFKLDIIKKQNGTYFFRFGNLDATTSTEIQVAGTNYNTKEFVFYNLTTNEIKDRELADWDLWAIQYHDWYNGMAADQVVTGILTNPKWEVAKVNVGTGNQSSHVDYSSGNFIYNKNAVGQGYKYMNQAYQWVVYDDEVYYLRNEDGEVWKWYPTKFMGAGYGRTVFYKQQIGFLGLEEQTIQFVDIYPNPAQDILTVVFDSKANNTEIIVRNQMGQVVSVESFNTTTGVAQQKLDISAFTNGVYFVEVNQNGFSTVKSIVKH